MDRPNVLLITTDQHRWDWLGCHGTSGVETPHLDRLAARGMRFTHHVTNSAVCAPARIGLATGITPIRIGAVNNQSVLRADVPTYYQALRDVGYRVGCAGKLDLNKPDQDNGRRGDRPDLFRWGFTHPVEIEGKFHAGGVFGKRPLGPYGYWLEERGLWEEFSDDYDERMKDMVDAKYGNDHTATDSWYRDSVLPADAWADSYIGLRARDWLHNVADDHPWHLYVSFVGPHDPFDPPAEWAERFRDAPVPEPVGGDMTGRPARVKAEQYPHSPEQIMVARRQYTAALALIDHQVGELLATLDALDQTDNTLVIFTADHGEMLGDHRLFQKGVAYEPSMRIPLLVAGPDVGVGVSDALTELIDVTATIVDAAGSEMPGIDGRSLTPLLAGQPGTVRDHVTCIGTKYRAVRTERWKYSHNARDEAREDEAVHELFDLEADPAELHNVIADHADVANDLHDLLMLFPDN